MSLGSHERPIGKSQEYITPKWIIDTFGPFDLDPCAAADQPWNTAKEQWTNHGLILDWSQYGMVWLNPPFHRRFIEKWLGKMATHNNGIALLHARTETTAWHSHVWGAADGILFLKGRLRFYDIRGIEYKHNSGAPPVLVSWGMDATHRLWQNARGLGFFTAIT